MDLSQLSVMVTVVAGCGAVGGGLVRAARALVRAAGTGQRVVAAVEANTKACGRLSGQFEAYQQVTDRRLEILEEAHRRGWRPW